MTKEEYIGRFLALYAYRYMFKEQGNEKGISFVDDKIAETWKQMREDLDMVDFTKVWAEVHYMNEALTK